MDAVMKKLVLQLQESSIYTVGPPSSPSVQPSGQNLFHSLPSVCLTANPISSTHYRLSNSHTLLDSRSPTHCPCSPIMDSHHKNCQICSFARCYPSTLIYSNEIDGRSRVEAGESSAHSKPTELSMYSKNPVISLLNLPLNYITDFAAAFSARSLTHDNEKNSGKPILVASTARNNGTPRISVGNSTIVPHDGRNVPTMTNWT